MTERSFPAGAAIVPVGAFELARATGGDRLSFLHRLLTGKIEGLQPGQGTRALLLTVKGHIVADTRVAAGAESVRLVMPPGQGASTVAALSRYAVMDDFEVRLDGDMRLLAVHGPDSEAKLGQVGVDVPSGFLAGPRLSHADVRGPDGDVWLLRETAAGAPGIWVFGSPPAIEALRAGLGLQGVGELPAPEAEVLRIRAGEPRFGAEINDEYFPMEVGLSGAIDYAKGCYLGQEPIVRIRDRGRTNWRLVTLAAREVGPIAVGDRLESETKPKAGRVTSVAALPGQPAVALGMLHVSVPTGATVRIRSAAAETGTEGAADAPAISAEVTGEPEDA